MTHPESLTPLTRGLAMITSTKLYVLLTGASTAAVVGAGPALSSDLPLTALLAAGAGTVTAGVYRMIGPATEH